MEEGKIPIRHPSMVSRGICLFVFGGSDETYAFTHTHTHMLTHMLTLMFNHRPWFKDPPE